MPDRLARSAAVLRKRDGDGFPQEHPRLRQHNNSFATVYLHVLHPRQVYPPLLITSALRKESAASELQASPLSSVSPFHFATPSVLSRAACRLHANSSCPTS